MVIAGGDGRCDVTQKRRKHRFESVTGVAWYWRNNACVALPRGGGGEGRGL